MAEQMGVISQISDFVLSEACGQCAEWRRKGLDLGLAVNLSGREFSDAGLVDRIAGHLEENGLPGEVLTLEVTETEVMADLTQVSMVLDKLAALGICLAIDDYGTGYSSLAYIHRLPVQELKIDRSFVTNLPLESSNAIIVHSSIAMAHSLGLKVVAEGAEDELTCTLLAEADCDFIQGYHISKPITSAQLQDKLLPSAPFQCAPSKRPRPVRGRALRAGRVVEGRRKGESTACAPSPCLQVPRGRSSLSLCIVTKRPRFDRIGAAPGRLTSALRRD